MPTLSLLLPTTLIFTCPNYARYEQVKNDFIKDKLAYCEGMSVNDKWIRLIDVFSNGLSTSDRDIFQSFKGERQRVHRYNLHVIQLDKALNYFENFYFLYRNDNPHYLLSDLAKKRLLIGFMEGMIPGVCEPGRIIQFEDSLQKARKDTNWILNELSRQRVLLTQRIADEYNAQYNVTDAYSIHTVMHMSKLGKQKGFGIELANEIDDVYLLDRSKMEMTSYFDQVAVQKFAQYERDAIPNLTQHVMFEMTQWLRLNGVNLTAWEANEIALSEKQVVDFNRFIPSLFENQTMHGLGEYSDDEPTFYLFNKTTFYRNIQQWVKGKLIEDAVFLDLAVDNIDNAQLVNVHWPLGTNSVAAIKFLEEIYRLDARSVIDYANVLNPDQTILLHCPTLFLVGLIKILRLGLHLPKGMRKNVVFMDKLVSVLGTLLSESEPENECALIDVLWTFTKANSGSLKCLSTDVLNKKSIALKLLAKDGLLLRWMSDEGRADPELQLAAANQNSMAKMYAINYDQPNMLLLQYNDVVTQIAALDIVYYDSLSRAIDHRGQLRFADLEKMQNMLTLLKQPFISTWCLIRLAERLGPRELYQVNRVRLVHGLSSLPHCNGFNLAYFSDYIGQVDSLSSNGYLSAKREITASEPNLNPVAFLSNNYQKRIAEQAILESTQWVSAFIAYQKQLPAYDFAFRSVDDVMSQLQINAKAFHAFWVSNWRLLRDLGRPLFSSMILVALCLFEGGLGVLSTIMMAFLVINQGIMFPALISIIALMASWLLLVGYFGYVIYLAIRGLDPHYYFSPEALRHARNEPFIQGTICFIMIMLYIIVMIPEMLFFIVLNIALVPTILLLISLLVMLISLGCGLSINNSPSWTGIGDIVVATLASSLHVFSQWITFFSSMWAVITEWPQLFVASFLPWITRTLAAMVSQIVTPTGVDALKINIEDNIFRLLNSDESSAVTKGELLEVLWEKVQADADPLCGHEPSFRKSLDKQYTVPVSGEKRQLSFWDVAATPRVDATQFIPKALDARFSFFGLRGRTTTTSQLPHAEMTPQS